MILAALLNYEGKVKDFQYPEGIDECIEIDQKGIGAACNLALYNAFEVLRADYLLLLANDIVEPQDTIERRLEAFKYPNAGIVTTAIAPMRTKTAPQVAGNFMISKKTFDKIGYYTTEWDNTYGAIDLHYSYRNHLVGLKNLITENTSKHLDNGDTAYGFSKKQALQTTLKEYGDWKRNPTIYYNSKGKPVRN